MKTISILIAVACLAVVGCDNKETRSGSITLTGSSNIPLNDKSGAHAELVAGQAEITFQKGSKDHTIAIQVKQPGRADVNIEAPVNGDPRSGDFTLRGADIGQPVDMISSRRFSVTGPSQRWSNWEDRGFERCMVETTFDPCDENWTVDFRSAAGALGSFSALTATRCNERSYDAFCQPNGREPRIPDFPRGPHGRALQDVLSQDPTKINFDSAN
jgi:hypothetical protein